MIDGRSPGTTKRYEFDIIPKIAFGTAAIPAGADTLPNGISISPKLSFGRAAIPGGHPYLAAIRRIISRTGSNIRSLHHCGGVILSEFWVLSAAHCFLDKVNLNVGSVIVRVGDYNNRDFDLTEKEYQPENIIIHERFHVSTYESDIALIRIKPDINGRGIQLIKNVIWPANLPMANTKVTPETVCYISGWGDTQNGKTSILQEALLNFLNPVDQIRCKNLYLRKRLVTPTMFCAGNFGDPVDTCVGDSGGPFICRVGGRSNVLIGITSWGVSECGNARFPGVYTNVYSLMNWIRRQTGLMAV